MPVATVGPNLARWALLRARVRERPQGEGLRPLDPWKGRASGGSGELPRDAGPVRQQYGVRIASGSGAGLLRLERTSCEPPCKGHGIGPTWFGMNSSEEPEPSMASWQRPDLVLVGCVKTKRRVRSAAKDLYSSPLWRHRRAYAECLGVPWYILSALHGLLDPDRRVDAYELALTDLRA